MIVTSLLAEGSYYHVKAASGLSVELGRYSYSLSSVGWFYQEKLKNPVVPWFKPQAELFFQPFGVRNTLEKNIFA